MKQFKIEVNAYDLPDGRVYNVVINDYVIAGVSFDVEAPSIPLMVSDGEYIDLLNAVLRP